MSKSPAEQAKERGNAAFKKGKLDAAVDCYTEAIAFDPDVSIYYTNRAFCLFKKAGDITSENTERIEADSRKSLELDPRNAKGNFYLGKVLASRGEWDSAIHMFQRAYDILPPFKDDVQKALRQARKQRGKESKEQHRQKASEAYNCLLGLLKKAKGELGDETYKQVSVELHKQFKTDLEVQTDIDDTHEVPEHLQCKISFEPLIDPVITPGGLTYERSVILDHLRRGNNFEPVTREPLRADQLYPNKSIRDAVDLYAEEHPECFEL